MSDELDRADEPVFACETCGGSGVEPTEEIIFPTDDLAEDMKVGWLRQMRNRPAIHKAIDSYLSFDRNERIDNPTTLLEILVETQSYIDSLVGGCQMVRQLPKDERGRHYKQIQMDLFTVAAELIWFHAANGYPKRSSVGRLLKELKNEKANPADDAGPDWDGGTK